MNLPSKDAVLGEDHGTAQASKDDLLWPQARLDRQAPLSQLETFSPTPQD